MLEAGGLINTIDPSKFPFLLTRIITKLYVAESIFASEKEINGDLFSSVMIYFCTSRHVRNEPTFSSAEHEQLCSRFAMNEGQLRTVLEALSYVFEQVVCRSLLNFSVML
jgi:hypothetical protein